VELGGSDGSGGPGGSAERALFLIGAILLPVLAAGAWYGRRRARSG
jgi:hypothetical protein